MKNSLLGGLLNRTTCLDNNVESAGNSIFFFSHKVFNPITDIVALFESHVYYCLLFLSIWKCKIKFLLLPIFQSTGKCWQHMAKFQWDTANKAEIFTVIIFAFSRCFITYPREIYMLWNRIMALYTCIYKPAKIAKAFDRSIVFQTAFNIVSVISRRQLTYSCIS